MLNRRDLLKLSGAATMASLFPFSTTRAATFSAKPFLFCLNTSTISGQKPGLLKYIDIASEAGYDGVELWVSDVKEHVAKGNSLQSLAAYLKAKNITVFDAISFTSWMADDEAERQLGLAEMEEEMKMLSAIGCKRMAAPPAGVKEGTHLDIQQTAKHYEAVLQLGRKYNISPLLEFWGASGTLYNFSQALAIAAATDDADAKILPDVYHLFRGGSGFNCLGMVNGKMIDIIHMNDYPDKPVNELSDSDRVYPGDGIAPLKQILQSLKNIGGTKILSLELFNESYWKQDALQVAKTGLLKMRKLAEAIA